MIDRDPSSPRTWENPLVQKLTPFHHALVPAHVGESLGRNSLTLLDITHMPRCTGSSLCLWWLLLSEHPAAHHGLGLPPRRFDPVGGRSPGNPDHSPS